MVRRLKECRGAGPEQHVYLGLLGHLDSAMRASKTRARIDASKIPILPGIRELAREGVVPGGTQANLAFVSERATFPESMTAPDRLVLADAQTNGGMLAAVDAKAAAKILKALAAAGAPAAAIGEVTRAKGTQPGIDVIGEMSAAPVR